MAVHQKLQEIHMKFHRNPMDLRFRKTMGFPDVSCIYIVPFHNSSPYQSIEPSYFAGEFVKSTTFAGDLFIFSHGLTCFDPDLSFTGCPRQLQDIFQRPLPG